MFLKMPDNFPQSRKVFMDHFLAARSANWRLDKETENSNQTKYSKLQPLVMCKCIKLYTVR